MATGISECAGCIINELVLKTSFVDILPEPRAQPKRTQPTIIFGFVDIGIL